MLKKIIIISYCLLPVFAFSAEKETSSKVATSAIDKLVTKEMKETADLQKRGLITPDTYAKKMGLMNLILKEKKQKIIGASHYTALDALLHERKAALDTKKEDGSLTADEYANESTMVAQAQQELGVLKGEIPAPPPLPPKTVAAIPPEKSPVPTESASLVAENKIIMAIETIAKESKACMDLIAQQPTEQTRFDRLRNTLWSKASKAYEYTTGREFAAESIQARIDKAVDVIAQAVDQIQAEQTQKESEYISVGLKRFIPETVQAFIRQVHSQSYSFLTQPDKTELKNAYGMLEQLLLVMTDLLSKEIAHLQTIKPENIALKNLAFRRLIMLIHPDRSEKKDPADMGAIGEDLLTALMEEASPICASTMLMMTFLEARQKNLLSHHLTNNAAPADNRAFIAQHIPFTQEHWYCFIVPESDFVLLIPKNYINDILGHQTLTFTEEEENARLGFKITQLRNISLANEQSSEAEKQKLAADLLAQLKTQHDQYSPMVDASIHTDLQTFIIPYDPTNSYANFSWNIYAAGHGQYRTTVAGLAIPSFIDLLLFFNANTKDEVKAKANFLFYLTCFGGSKLNVDLIFKAFEGEENPLGYPVALAGILATVITTEWARRPIIHLPNGIETYEPIVHFGKAFSLLETNQPHKAVLHELIFSSLASVSIFSTPQIHFPKTNTSVVVPLADTTKLVTSNAAKARALEQKPIIIDGTKKNFIFNTPTILAPLTITSSFEGKILFLEEGNNYAATIHAPSLKSMIQYLKKTTDFIVHIMSGGLPSTYLFISTLECNDTTDHIFDEQNQDVTQNYYKNGKLTLHNAVICINPFITSIYIPAEKNIVDMHGKEITAGDYIELDQRQANGSNFQLKLGAASREEKNAWQEYFKQLKQEE